MKTIFSAGLLSVLGAVAIGFAAQTPDPQRPLTTAQPIRRAVSTTPAAGSSQTKTGTKPATPQPGVIGHVETRDRLITIMAGAKEPVYTVRSKQGRVLYEKLSGKDLQAKAPELYELVKSSYARAPGASPAAIDASLRLPAVHTDSR